MKKKFITLGIAFLMLFSLAACNTDFDLEKYKADAKLEIENYAIESNYSSENLSIVCSIVDAGKAAVDTAENKVGVDKAVTTAKSEIDEVEKEIEIVREKLYDSWWDGKVEVTLDFPRTVKQGESFSITIITTNITCEFLEYWLPCCDEDQGYLGVRISVESHDRGFILPSGYTESEGETLSSIDIGGSVEHTMEFQTSDVPKGVYDIFLLNGEVYRNAITIII